MTDIKPVSFEVAGMKIAGLRGNGGARHRALAVHGWLDNANSFVPMMPLLTDIDLVAIDLPGHGHSDHLPSMANYHLLDLPYFFFKIAEQLDWPAFHYLGHSLGACLAPFTAVANPDPIQSIILLEASGPLSESPDKLPERVRRSHLDKIKSEFYEARTFETIEDGIDARLLATTMSRRSAQLIVERQMKPAANGGFCWRYDPKHRLASPLYMSEEQVLSVLSAVTCSTLLVVSSDGYVLKREESKARFAQLQPDRLETVSGNHHMHMDDPAPSAQLINEFITQVGDS